MHRVLLQVPLPRSSIQRAESETARGYSGYSDLGALFTLSPEKEQDMAGMARTAAERVHWQLNQ